MDLHSRCALITGAGSGLGRATALAFAYRGARLALLDLDGAATKATAEAAETAGSPAALGIETNVADPSSVAAALAEVDGAFGTVHVCVNAAGVPTAGKVVTGGEALPLDRFRSVIEVNLIGAFDVTRHCAERMVGNEPDEDGERGVIINVSSGAAWQGQTGQAAYAASKAGIIGLTLPVARDLARDGVRVLAIAPGLFDTAMVADIPDKIRAGLEKMALYPKRLGQPEEFAELACHVVANRYLNATTLSIDGGMRMS